MLTVCGPLSAIGTAIPLLIYGFSEEPSLKAAFDTLGLSVRRAVALGIVIAALLVGIDGWQCLPADQSQQRIPSRLPFAQPPET